MWCVQTTHGRLPPIEKKLSRSAAIRYLEPKIRDLRARGHSLAQISDLLTSEGLPATYHTLRDALKVRAPKADRESQPD
jgi:hypothetical protein